MSSETERVDYSKFLPEDYALVDRLEVNNFSLDVKNNPLLNTSIVVVGLGATGSAFTMILAQYLKYSVRNRIDIYDFDSIEPHNHEVSMYGLFAYMNIGVNSSSKSTSSHRLINTLSGRSSLGNRNNNEVQSHNQRVNCEVLKENHDNIDYIFVFTDNNESRYEISKYHTEHPNTVVLDCRVGSYNQYEVYISKNPSKYAQTIYYDEDEQPRNIETNNICLDQRMNFSIAMASSALLMNLFVTEVRGEFDKDFKHIMLGKDYIGEIGGYV